MVVNFSPHGISQSFLGQVSFGAAFTRVSYLDMSDSGGQLKLATGVKRIIKSSTPIPKSVFWTCHFFGIKKEKCLVVNLIIQIDSSEFLGSSNDSWCKMTLKIHILKIKSFYLCNTWNTKQFNFKSSHNTQGQNGRKEVVRT